MDWSELCRDHGIPYDESGISVKRGNINIACPFCPPNESRLMGLEIGTARWACWKSARHRGSNAAYLIKQLTGCSEETAKELAGFGIASSVSDLRARLDALGSPPKSKVARLPRYELPSGCFPLRPDGHRSRRFVQYLERRGLPREAVTRYQLHGSDSGDFRGRVVVPIVCGGRTVGATGRAIRKRDRRYHTLPGGVGTQAMQLEQLATGGRLLVIVEGPFDAMALDWAAHTADLPVHAVALGGLALTMPKRVAIDRIASNYDRTVLLMDSTALTRSLELQRELGAEVTVGQLPESVGDAGELAIEPARDLLRHYLPPVYAARARRRSRTCDLVLDSPSVLF